MSNRAAPHPSETPTKWSTAAVSALSDVLDAAFGENLAPSESLVVSLFSGDGAARLEIDLVTTSVTESFAFFMREITVTPDALDGDVLHLVDYAGAILGAFFEADRDARLPLDFVGQPYENRTVYSRQTSRNPALEAQADELLDANTHH